MKKTRISGVVWSVSFILMADAAAQTFTAPVGANGGTYPLNTNSLWVGDGQYGLNSNGGMLRMLNTANGGGIAFRLNLNGTFTDAMFLNGSGHVGIGTINPASALHVYGRFTGGGVPQIMVAAPDTNDGSNGVINFRSGAQDIAQILSSYSSSGGYGYGHLLFATRNGESSGPQVRMTITEPGNVGIGTTNPGNDLAGLPTHPASTTPVFEVNGDIALSQGNGGQMFYPDGTVQSTAWNGTTLGGDYAEAVDVLGDRTEYEPGDLIVIDPAEPGKFMKSDKVYSRLVAGVYSTKPGLVGRRTTADRPNKDAEVPMAMMGIVPTKVSAENGPIEPGDLLVSASTPGYVMKGTDASRMMGAVIGKALAPLPSGKGIIETLISLQ